MNIYFDLAITQEGVLQIEDQTQAFNEYLPEDSNFYITPGRFKFSDTYTINIIKQVTTETTNVLDVIITSHINKDGELMHCDETYYPLIKDGHYIIEHIIIPSLDCLNKIDIESYNFVYGTDGIDIYKWNGVNYEKCSELDLLEDVEGHNTISRSSQETFSLFHLNQTYLKLCKEHLYKLMKNLCASKEDAHDLELDLMWLSLNAIKYNVEFGMLNQAQQLLEEIYKCTGISKLVNNDLNTDNQYGCKCCM